MATAEAVATAIAALSAAYRVEVDKATAVTWSRAVRDLADDVLGEAVEAWVKNSPRFPRPSEILETARIIVRRRTMRTPALPPERPDPDRQRSINRHGMALVRNKLAQGKLRVGKNLDDVLSEPEA